MTIETPGQIYVIEFSDETIKVGFSAYADGRMTGHAADATRRKLAITQRWMSEVHANAGANETALINFCSATTP